MEVSLQNKVRIFHQFHYILFSCPHFLKQLCTCVNATDLSLLCNGIRQIWSDELQFGTFMILPRDDSSYLRCLTLNVVFNLRRSSSCFKKQHRNQFCLQESQSHTSWCALNLGLSICHLQPQHRDTLRTNVCLLLHFVFLCWTLL